MERWVGRGRNRQTAIVNLVTYMPFEHNDCDAGRGSGSRYANEHGRSYVGGKGRGADLQKNSSVMKLDDFFLEGGGGDFARNECRHHA